MTNSVTEKWGFNPVLAKERIVKGIRDWFDQNFKRGNAVLGISGGKDSTVCAYLLCEAIGKDRVIGVTMPNGVQKDINDSNRVCDLLGITKLEINIQLPFDGIVSSISEYTHVTDQTKMNLAPRLRMTTLFAVGQSMNAAVINTGNLSEYMLGWFTFGSDTCGSYAPIMDYTVSEVYEIGEVLGIPHDLLYKTPSDGLCGMSDEEKFGFSYAVCDELIRTGLCEDEKVKEKIVKMNNSSAFKRIKIKYPKSLYPKWFGLLDEIEDP